MQITRLTIDVAHKDDVDIASMKEEIEQCLRQAGLMDAMLRDGEKVYDSSVPFFKLKVDDRFYPEQSAGEPILCKKSESSVDESFTAHY